MKKTIAILALIMLSACSTNSDRYKMLLGKRCTHDGTKFSYVWFHTVYGDEQVKKEWCRND